MTTEEIPEGWTECLLPEIAHLIMGQSPPGASYNDDGDGLPFFQGKADFGLRYPTTRKWCSAPTKIAQPGDVLMSIRAPVGPTNVANQECAIGRGLAAIRPKLSTLTEILLYTLRFQEEHIAAQGTGSTFTAINRSHLDEIVVLLPPLNEQHRIVSKVESLLARIQATTDRLTHVPTILKRFREAVLSAAFSGALTETWRETRSATETGADTVQRVSANRIKRRDEIADMSPRSRPVSLSDFDNLQPALRDDLDLPAIPEEWTWVDLRFLMNPEEAFCYGVVQPGEDDPSGPRLIRICDIEGGKVLIDNLRGISPSVQKQYSRSVLVGGEVLVSVVGTIGRSAIAPPEAAGVNIARAVAKLPIRDFNNRFLDFWLGSRSAQEWMVGDAREVARKTLNLEQLRTLPCPVPPADEAEEIVCRIDALFKLADAIGHRVSMATLRAEKLTQAILAKAFRGELVPTEAELARLSSRDFEPASELLERVTKQTETPTKATGTRKGTEMAARSKKRSTERKPLVEVLEGAKKGMASEQLFDAAGFDEDSIEQFYNELRDAIQQGTIREERPNKADVILKAV
jgi:type I restriction enzyme S subunit